MNEPEYNVLPAARRTVPAMLQRQLAEFAQRPLLSIAGTRWTHGEAADAVARRAGTLLCAGVKRGDRVAIMCGNRVEMIEVFLACGWIGAASVPINTASMGPQIHYFLADSGAKLLVIEDVLTQRLQAADLSRTALQSIWIVGDGTVPPAKLGGVTCEAFPSAKEAVEPQEVQPGETLAILYTSGTTGPAKGVICPHAQYYWWGVNTGRILTLTSADVLCTTLPLFHINALNTLAQATLVGCEVVYGSRFSASSFWLSMLESKATVVYLLGAMVPILLAQPTSAAERSHFVRIGLGPGVPLSAGEAFASRTGVSLLEGYGSTETNFAIATYVNAPRSGVMGWLQPGFQARVADVADSALPDGEVGELLLRAEEPFAFATGYFNMPEKTIDAWRNFWFHTGDRVIREPDGAFRFIDRMKDAIRRRGESISSYEVEQVLLSHPSVATVAVYPVSSDLAEDEVMAAIIVKTSDQLELVELARYCEARLPYFAIPRYIDVVDDLPRTENGKVQKFKLRERGVTLTTWDRLPALRPAAKL